jgi:miniconductance mechanosensitive channel
MEQLLHDLQALLLPWVHTLLTHLGLDPNRGTLLDRLLLLVLGKGLAVGVVLVGQHLLAVGVRRLFEFYHRRRGDEATAPFCSALQMTLIALRALSFLAVAGILLDLTVSRLVTLVSASAALLVLMFRDTVLGFVAGSLLLRNRMIRPGDWLTLSTPVVQGQVEEISIMTVRLRDHDNTFHYVPTYTLLTRTFQNWSGMKERGARLVTRTLLLDVTSVREAEGVLNVTLFRLWVSRYLRERPEVTPQPFLLVRQGEEQGRGLPLELMFFLRSTVWLEVEQQTTVILEGVMAGLSAFGLRLYQYGNQK